MEELAKLPAPSADEAEAIRKAQASKSKRRPAVKLALKQKGRGQEQFDSRNIFWLPTT